MNSISIGIFFIDKEYGEELSKALVTYYKNFNVHILMNEPKALQNTEFTEDIMQSGSSEGSIDKTDVLITDTADFYNGNESKNVIYVSDVKEKGISKGVFYKYDSVHSLADHIAMTLQREKKKVYPVQADRQGEIYVFAGAAGGTGNTSIALTAARSLCRFHGKRVFFIPLTFFCREVFSTVMEKGGENTPAIQRFMYDLETSEMDKDEREPSETDAFPLEKYVARDSYGVMYFNSGSNLNYIRHMESAQISLIIKILSEALKVDMFIVDAGSDFAVNHLNFLQCSRKVFVVHRKGADIEGTDKVKKLFQKTDVNEAVVYNIVNFADETEEAGIKTECEGTTVFIHEDSDSFRQPEGGSKKYEIEQDREFGMEVAEFVQKCILWR